MLITYSILDPTGNITALVESELPAPERAAVAAEIMRRHPEAEQLGFLRRLPDSESVRGALDMAGGEFCGNASLCAAVLLSEDAAPGEERALLLRVSGASDAVEVRLRREAAENYTASVRMPPALWIGRTELRFRGQRAPVPLVRMEGIAHLIVCPGSAFYPLLNDPKAAEEAVKSWCAALGAPCLGLMFLSGRAPALSLTPLVWVPGSGTVFWESSCASGSAAVGMALAAERGGCVELSLTEPGGTLRVRSAEETRLCGSVRLRGRHTL